MNQIYMLVTATFGQPIGMKISGPNKAAKSEKVKKKLKRANYATTSSFFIKFVRV